MSIPEYLQKSDKIRYHDQKAESLNPLIVCENKPCAEKVKCIKPLPYPLFSTLISKFPWATNLTPNCAAVASKQPNKVLRFPGAACGWDYKAGSC